MASEHRLIIGRDSSCDVVLNDPYASPKHAALIWVRDGGVIQVADLGSTNGTWLNRERVWEPRLVTFTDSLRFGRTQLDVGLLLLKLAHAAGIAEGRRQATDGYSREWAVELDGEDEGVTWAADDEEEARQVARRGRSGRRRVVSRLIGPWEPAARPGMCGAGAPASVPGRHFGSCLLVAGHEGDHNAGGDAAWEPAEQPEPAPRGAGVCDRCGEWDANPQIAQRCPTCGQPWSRLVEPARAGTVEPSGPPAAEDANPNVCPKSKRVDGPFHSTRWDGDDPRTVCVYCGQVRDALTGAVIREAGRG